MAIDINTNKILKWRRSKKMLGRTPAISQHKTLRMELYRFRHYGENVEILHKKGRKFLNKTEGNYLRLRGDGG